MTTETIPHTNGTGNGHGNGKSSGDIFAANVIALRKARGWTPQQLGKQYSPDSSSAAATISAIETGRQRGLDTVDRLAEVFGKTPSQMIEALPCDWCAGSPPPGYTCIACDAATPRPEVIA